MRLEIKEIKQICIKYLKQKCDEGLCYDYIVKCDEENNPLGQNYKLIEIYYKISIIGQIRNVSIRFLEDRLYDISDLDSDIQGINGKNLFKNLYDILFPIIRESTINSLLK